MPELRLNQLLKSAPVPLGKLARFENSRNLVPKEDMWENAQALINTDFPSHPVAGIYCFWWLGDKSILTNQERHRGLKIKGKHVPKDEISYYEKHGIIIEPFSTKKKVKQFHAIHQIEWQFNEVKCKDQSLVPLYAGKSSNIYSRIRKHFEWRISDKNKKDTWEKSFLHKPTTACQFRSGFEYLFQDIKDESVLNDYLLDKVGLTFQPMALHAIYERFYLEDLAIGWLKPCFNVDSER